MRLYVATGNKNKLKEIGAILSPLKIEVITHPDYDSINVEETGSTFEENAALKALALSELTSEYVIADDSGISVKCLNGAPGIYSARYAGNNATDLDNNNLLLKTMEKQSDRDASFICVIALAKGGKIVKTFFGECKGKIARKAYGSGGFGYDPLFLISDKRSMAMLSVEEKNSISHRKIALEGLYNYFKDM